MGKPLDPAHDHRISLEAAAAMTKAHRDGGTLRTGDSAAYNAKALLDLLQQPGCVGMRYYKGRTKAGESSMVLVGVDKDGNDMVGGILIDNGMPCPPWCSDGNVLTG